MKHTRHTLRDVLIAYRDIWDQEGFRESVRDDFLKAIRCGTGELGAEVFASDAEERIVNHTCKGRACSSCGSRGTTEWQRHLWADLPDGPYAHLTLTMPNELWPLFCSNRHALHRLPALAGELLKQHARLHGVRIIIIVIPHTFGSHLNFNCHLHVLVSQGGLRLDGAGWHQRCLIDRETLMSMWRFGVTTLLQRAAMLGKLDTPVSRGELKRLLEKQGKRRWNVHIKNLSSKNKFLSYAGRYLRRPPIANHRIRKIDSQEIRFLTKDTRLQEVVEDVLTPEAFMRALADHIPDRYRHGVRHFGLLAPRVKSQTHDAIFSALRQTRRPRPRRIGWAESLRRKFGIDPLLDNRGTQMRWTRRLKPTTTPPPLAGL